MKPSLTISIESAPIERVVAELAVVTLFESDRPLRGEAGRVDWRLCGLLSQLIARGVVTGGLGDAALVPTFGRLRAARVLVLGLGASAGFGALDVKQAVRAAVERVARLGAGTVALALPGHWTGLLPAGPAAGAVLRGASAALADTGGDLRLRLLVPEGASARAQGGVEAAIRQTGESGITLRLAGAEPVSVLGTRPSARSLPPDLAALPASRG